jgi:hypothetical protein
MLKLFILSALSLLALPAMAAAGISVDGLLSLVIYVVIIGLIFWCVWWFLGTAGIPEPFNKIIRVVVGLIALVIVVNLLLGFAGHPFMTLR